MNRDEIEQIARINAEAQKAQPTGPKYLYRTTCKCPGCGTDWVFEEAQPAGVIDPHPKSSKLGLALLCGVCEARRRLWINRLDGKPVPAWDNKVDSPRAWDLLRRNWGAYDPIVNRIGQFEGGTLRDDKQAKIDEIRGTGKPASMVSMEYARSMRWI